MIKLRAFRTNLTYLLVTGFVMFKNEVKKLVMFPNKYNITPKTISSAQRKKLIGNTSLTGIFKRSKSYKHIVYHLKAAHGVCLPTLPVFSSTRFLEEGSTNFSPTTPKFKCFHCFVRKEVSELTVVSIDLDLILCSWCQEPTGSTKTLEGHSVKNAKW